MHRPLLITLAVALLIMSAADGLLRTGADGVSAGRSIHHGNAGAHENTSNCPHSTADRPSKPSNLHPTKNWRPCPPRIGRP